MARRISIMISVGNFSRAPNEAGTLVSERARGDSSGGIIMRSTRTRRDFSNEGDIRYGRNRGTWRCVDARGEWNSMEESER